MRWKSEVEAGKFMDTVRQLQSCVACVGDMSLKRPP